MHPLTSRPTKYFARQTAAQALCTKCKQTKLRSEFSERANGSIHSWCKKCRIEYDRDVSRLQKKTKCNRPKPNKWGYPGVYKRYDGKFSGQITINKIRYCVGVRDTPEEVAQLYMQAKNDQVAFVSRRRTRSNLVVLLDRK